MKKKKKQKKKNEDTAKLHSAVAVVNKLAKLNEGLAAVVGMYLAGDMDDKDSLEKYDELLQQLLAYESVLQFAPESTWPSLWAFARKGSALARDPTFRANLIARLLVVIPALGKVAHHEQARTARCSKALCMAADFVLRRAIDVTSRLKKNKPSDAAADPAKVAKQDFHLNGRCYNGPQFRNRPKYNGLPYDAKVERSVVTDSDGIGCPKHYSSYGTKGLTGGIMAIWCTHCICLGFHFIPKGEGCNDSSQLCSLSGPRRRRSLSMTSRARSLHIACCASLSSSRKLGFSSTISTRNVTRSARRLAS